MNIRCLSAVIVCLALTAPTAAQQSCGRDTQVRDGDTLSSIAARCGVTEGRILDLNPKVEGSKDLRTGMTLSLAPPTGREGMARAREAGESLMQRLRGYARDAGEAVGEITAQVTGSAEDFLARNPDLHQKVRKLGQRLNVPGMEKVEAQVSMSVRKGPPGTAVTLSAIGLPANQPLEVAGGVPDRDYLILAQTRTTAEGTLQVTVQVPQEADPQRDFIFLLANPALELAARSATFDVVPATSGTGR